MPGCLLDGGGGRKPDGKQVNIDIFKAMDRILAGGNTHVGFRDLQLRGKKREKKKKERKWPKTLEKPYIFNQCSRVGLVCFLPLSRIVYIYWPMLHYFFIQFELLFWLNFTDKRIMMKNYYIFDVKYHHRSQFDYSCFFFLQNLEFS